MNSNPFISIIVPVYNSEMYLQQCIESIINQSETDYELLLIDDGSTDRSGKLCDKYSNNNDKVKVVHTKNRGVSSARNLGLRMARGDWIFFLDSDDVMENDILKEIRNYIVNNIDVDMVLGSYSYNYEDNNVSPVVNQDALKQGIEAVREYGLWNLKILMGSYFVSKAVIIKYSLLFIENTLYGEDVEFINYCLINSNKVGVTSQNFFYYNVHNGSAISKVNFRRFDCVEAKKRILNYINDRYPESTDLKKLYINRLLPEAIIDTTYLLSRHGVNIVKILRYLYKNSYINILQNSLNSSNQFDPVRLNVSKFLNHPILTWLECLLQYRYYLLRSRLALLKRRIVDRK